MYDGLTAIDLVLSPLQQRITGFAGFRTAIPKVQIDIRESNQLAALGILTGATLRGVKCHALS